jgi:hypothetical protein
MYLNVLPMTLATGGSWWDSKGERDALSHIEDLHTWGRLDKGKNLLLR